MLKPDKQLNIFLSSTCLNLKDVRGALKYHLESIYDFKVLASEFKDFPVTLMQHSYEECISRVRKSDFFILIIDERFGGVYREENGKRVSITEAEFITARDRGIPVVTFVRERVWEQRNDFKKSLKREGTTAAEHFENFRKTRDSCVDDIGIFDLIDAVNSYVPTHSTKQDVTNWIRPFKDGYDILEYVDIFINEEVKSSFFLDANVKEIPLKLSRYSSGISRSVAEKNEDTKAILSHMKGMNRIAESSNRLKLMRHRNERLEDVTYEESGVIENLEIFRGDKPSFIAVDTSWETINLDVWKANDSFKRVLGATKNLNNRENLSFYKYIRLMVLGNPQNIISHVNFPQYAQHMLDFHRKHQVKLGFVIMDKIVTPIENDLRLLNFYLIPDKALTIWDPLTGYTLECARNNTVKDLIEMHTDWCDEIMSHCDSESAGFWASESMTPRNLSRQINDLYSSV